MCKSPRVASPLTGRACLKFIVSAVKPRPLGLGYKAETIQAQVL